MLIQKQTKRTSRRQNNIIFELNHIVHDDIVSIKQILHIKPMIYNNEIPAVDNNSNDMIKNMIIVVIIMSCAISCSAIADGTLKYFHFLETPNLH